MNIQTREMQMLNDGADAPQDIEEKEDGLEGGKVFRVCNKITNIRIETRFSVPLGQKLPQRGDVITHWQGERLGDNVAMDEILSLLPANTLAIRVDKVLSVEQMSTDYTIEGAYVTIDGTLIIQ